MGLWSFFRKLLGKQAPPPEPRHRESIPVEPQRRTAPRPQPEPEPVEAAGEVTTIRESPGAEPSKLRVNVGFDFGIDLIFDSSFVSCTSP